ncbi:MAG TPA: adenylate/guanylate cyclase domain-containing protein [Anaerolineaceae bacterium]|nr:adenylate/guanylate cyclase domain-containing protein [Anaerolineaceae bacterium]HPN51829.1 adenylate/guanylate cyclase domain-containing protein [Anaerolineaceae bacterium]
MSLRVLLLQTDLKAAKPLVSYFTDKGYQIWQMTEVSQALAGLERLQPDLIVIDLHMPGEEWLQLISMACSKDSRTKILITNKTPDVTRETLARQQGADAFLRQPFTRDWIKRSMQKLGFEEGGEKANAVESGLKKLKVRVPVRVKITLPYALLALLFAIASVFIVGQVLLESIHASFINQLDDAGGLGVDGMVRVETRLLETLRFVANTSGVVEAVQAGDSAALREMFYPVAVNTREEAIEILDPNGTSLLSLRMKPGGQTGDYEFTRGETIYTDWDFVTKVLDRDVTNGRDKYAGLGTVGSTRYFYVSGPIVALDGSLAGVVLVGVTLPSLSRQLSDISAAGITFYDTSGVPGISTLFSLPDQYYPLNSEEVLGVLSNREQAPIRELQIGDQKHSELLTTWSARGETVLGIMGVSLPQVYLVRTSQITQIQIFLLVAGVFVVVVLIGITLANQITRPLLRVVNASAEVERGNLDVKVDAQGNDEVAALGQSFNHMVAGLQEGSMYRDLLGRTVSPEVREQLRTTFNSGHLRIEGQEAIATVLMSDIRGFTTLAEKIDPTKLFRWLNEYFGVLVPIIAANNGVVNKFDGDAILAFFGILPKLIDPKRGAYAACLTALEMLKAIERLNTTRMERGEPIMATGIGINTGVVTAGGLGTSDRLHYTIIGDTVNTTQRLEGLTRQIFDVSGVVISHSTYLALAEYRNQFKIEPLGPHAVKGKAEMLQVYRLLPLDTEQELL